MKGKLAEYEGKGLTLQEVNYVFKNFHKEKKSE